MNQLYNQVSGHTVGYIGFITNYMANYLNEVKSATIGEYLGVGASSDFGGYIN